MSRFSITYMNQSFYMPIMLSSEYDATAALWTTVLPTAAVALAYHFVLRPRKRQERLAYAPVLFFRGCCLSLTRRRPPDSSARHGASCAKPSQT